MKSPLIAAILLISLSGGGVAASEPSKDGAWQGEGFSSDSECPAFDFWVSVEGERVEGNARQTGTDYKVLGKLTDDGVFTGKVTYMFFEIASLNGRVGATQGSGEWVALKGPDCEGSFAVRKLQ